jgi:hypothetical protein
VKPLRDIVLPVLYFVEAVFWVAIVALGGGPLLLLAALSCGVSGVLLFMAPSNWLARPVAGAAALFVLALALYQAYEASTLIGSNLNTLGVESAATFGFFAVLGLYLELVTLSAGHSIDLSKKD